MTVLPEQLAIPKVHELMNDEGELNDPARQSDVLELGAKLAKALG